MNLEELAEKLAEKHEMSFDIITDRLTEILKMMCDALDAGEKVTFHGFGGYGIEVIVDSHKPEQVSPQSNMSFGGAIAALKQGHKVARKGWNGKGMWLILVEGQKEVPLREGSVYRNALNQEKCELLPHIDMWTVNAEGRRAMLCGWVASQTDILYEDWCIVE